MESSFRSNDSSFQSYTRCTLRSIDDSFSPERSNKIPPTCQRFQGRSFLGDIRRNLLASPSKYLSPHRLKNLRKRPLYDRFGQDKIHDYSFEKNQSFPRIRTGIKIRKMESEYAIPKPKQTMEYVRVDGPNGVRFNSSLASLSESPLPSGSGTSFPVDRAAQGINPNKAVFTIDSKTSQILIVNHRACSLLGYSSTELCALRLEQLLRARPPGGVPAAALQEGTINTDDGTLVLMSGKVVEMITGSGGITVVSLWIRQLEPDGPCLAVAEPVHIKQAIIYVDGETGVTTGCDSEEAALIFQCEDTERLIGLNISSLVPSIHMPSKDSSEISKNIAKQKATGRTFDGSTFPLCLWIRHHEPTDKNHSQMEEKDHPSKKLYDITVRVYHNVSGLLVVDEAGAISACNHHFTTLTFGKARVEVVGRPISSIITDFCHESKLVHPSAPRSRNMSLSPVQNHQSDSDTDPIEECGSRKSPTSQSIQNSLVSQVTRDVTKSSSCQNVDKTHTPTPTQDMVSSISNTEHRLDADLSLIPDVISGVSNISMDEDYYNSSISKSRSENILGSENRENNLNLANKHMDTKSSEKSDSVYFTSRKSVDYSVNGGHRTRATNDTNLKLNFDGGKCSKIGSVKSVVSLLDRSNMSLDLCDSNETSADFLTPINEMPLSGVCDNFTDDADLISEKCVLLRGKERFQPETRNSDSLTDSPNKPSDREWACVTPQAIRSQVMTSTPAIMRQAAPRVPTAPSHPMHPLHHQAHKDATYKGVVIHRDGTELSVIYTVSAVSLRGGGSVLCVWVGVSGPETSILHASSINSTAENSISIVHKQGSHNVSRPLSISLVSQCGEEQTSGDYNKNYVTLKQIGKGAYGCVKMAYRRSDRLLVIAKFIFKEKVNQQFWVDGNEKNGKKVPLEVSLLQTLKHPNIVNVLDVYENEKYFQMIMEKHGSGMDLFEFIERWPKLDEPLTSYIFRQIGQAVEYLHSLSILHRDIKDENVIIDNKFHVKLIDFGSATFRHDNVLFSTFYGTTEYCSPEVLKGNKYAGPELEMWSMGITLYILIFFENPFMDIEDTMRARVELPQNISNDLENLLRSMLCKDPEERCTISQLMAHPWLNQNVQISKYNFCDVIECEGQEAAPEIYYSGWGCSGSPLSAEEDAPSLTSRSATTSHTDPPAQALLLTHDIKTGVTLPHDGMGRDGDRQRHRQTSKELSAENKKWRSHGQGTAISAEKEAQSDNYSLRSSAEILDISKPKSDMAMNDVSSDATGRSACEFECDLEDQYGCDSWDECDQESLS